jgi:hypothetical protein
MVAVIMRIGHDVLNVQRRFCSNGPSGKHRAVIGVDRVLGFQFIKLLRREAVGTGKVHEFAVEGIDRSECAAAERNKIADDSIEDALRIRRRASNDAQHFVGRGLPLRRFGKLPPEARNLLLKFGDGNLRHCCLLTI